MVIEQSLLEKKQKREAIKKRGEQKEPQKKEDEIPKAPKRDRPSTNSEPAKKEKLRQKGPSASSGPGGGKDTSLAKKIGLMVATTVCSILSWHFLSSLLGVSSINYEKWIDFFYYGMLTYFILTFLFFLLLISMVALCAVLVRPRWLNYVNIGIASFIYFMFFDLSFYTFFAVLVLFLSFLYYVQRIGREMKENIFFSVFKNTKFGLGWVIAFTLIVVSLTYFQFITMQDKTVDGFGEAMVRYSSDAVNQVFTIKLEGYDKEMTLDEFIGRFGTDDLIDNLLNDSGSASSISLPFGLDKIITVEQNEIVDQLIEKESEAMEQQAIDQVRAELLEALKISATGDETMGTVISRLVQSKYDQYLSPYNNLVPSFLAFSLYFLLQVFSFLYKIIIKALIGLIYYILEKTGFIKYREIEVKAKRPVL